MCVWTYNSNRLQTSLVAPWHWIQWYQDGLSSSITPYKYLNKYWQVIASERFQNLISKGKILSFPRGNVGARFRFFCTRLFSISQSYNEVGSRCKLRVSPCLGGKSSKEAIGFCCKWQHARYLHRQWLGGGPQACGETIQTSSYATALESFWGHDSD